MSAPALEAAAAAAVTTLKDARARGDYEKAREIEGDMTMAVQAVWQAASTETRDTIAWLAGADL